MTSERFDVVIVGAGLSGIGAACHLRQHCPNKSFVILEGRESMGGTWDIFRYPGIRSDSDMFTLGYNFKPWTEGKAIADGPSILNYIHETSAEHEIDSHIRYRHWVTRLSWDSEQAVWTVTSTDKSTGATSTIEARFLLMCSGYYSYAQGHTPEFPGREDFRGTIVHPQAWPEDLDYSGKKVVVIGSGATAVTLIPELAKTTETVTMLQRSPTYMVSMPDEDVIANALRRFLPRKLAYRIIRWKNIRFQQFIYRQARKSPEKVRGKLLKLAKRSLGDYPEFERDFAPYYGPWDQRLCLVPNSDFFHAVRDRYAAVVTGEIDRFTEDRYHTKVGRNAGRRHHRDGDGSRVMCVG